MIYKALAQFFTQGLLAVVLLSCASVSFASADLKLTSCPIDAVAVGNHWQVFQDGTAQRTLEDIEQIAEPLWAAFGSDRVDARVPRSAYWYRMIIDNKTSANCRLWLTLGTVRITDVQLYSQQPNSDWLAQRVGTAYPFSQWASPQRIPSLPVVLPAHGKTTLVVRVGNNPTFTRLPQLLTQEALIKESIAQSLVDGMQAGVLTLLMLISLFVGYFLRLKVLLVNALVIFAYAVYLAMVQGYAFIYLWPQSVHWNAYSLLGMETLLRVVMLGYFAFLLQIKDQPQIIGQLVKAAQAGLILLFAATLWLPQVQWLGLDGFSNNTLTLLSTLIVVVAAYTGRRQSLAYDGFVYLLVTVFVVQNLLLILFFLDLIALAPTTYAILSISVVPSALVLSYILLNQVMLVRHREQLALSDLEQLKRAEQENLEQRVELRSQQLRHALDNQTMLLARVSHDLRSPLQHLIHDAILLQTTPERAGHYGQKIQHAAKQQLALIDELLEFSHGELKQLELLIAPGYLFGFLREIEESGMFLAQRNDNAFKTILADDLPLLVNADFPRLRQIIINLLANAAKFTQHGEIVFAVHLIKKDQQAGYADLQFVVTDNGIGIPKAECESLLQPFVRGQNSTGYEGTGLGLYIVRQILDSMGSALLIESSTLTGAQCSFTLHLELAVEQALEQVFIESYSSNEEGQQRTVLIVDDVAITREMLYELLAGYDYNPLTCSSAAEALIILREHPIDMVVTDQVMPGMDGWDLLRNVRKEWPQLPLLLYSARPPIRPVDLDVSVEFDACLLKPAVSADLLAQIKHLLG